MSAPAYGASCGIELKVGERSGMLLRRDGDRWNSGLCDQISPAELERAIKPFPAAPGKGVAHLLVAGPFHDAGMAALDRNGELVGWVFGSEGDQVSTCPGGRYAVQAGKDLSTIRLDDLRVVRRSSLPGDRTQEVRCLDKRGRDVVAVVGDFARDDVEHREPRSRLVRIRAGRARTIIARHVNHEALGVTHAYLGTYRAAGSRMGGGIIEVSYRSGRARVVRAKAPSWSDMHLSPDGRRLAIQTAGNVVAVRDLARADERSTRVRGDVAGIAWLSSDRLVVSRGDKGNVLTNRLKLVRTVRGWGYTRTVAPLGRRVWWVTDSYVGRNAGRISAVDTRTGTLVNVSRLRLDGATGMAAVPEGGTVTSGEQRAPRANGRQVSAPAAATRGAIARPTPVPSACQEQVASSNSWRWS